MFIITKFPLFSDSLKRGFYCNTIILTFGTNDWLGDASRCFPMRDFLRRLFTAFMSRSSAADGNNNTGDDLTIRPTNVLIWFASFQYHVRCRFTTTLHLHGSTSLLLLLFHVGKSATRWWLLLLLLKLVLLGWGWELLRMRMKRLSCFVQHLRWGYGSRIES